MSIDTSCTTTSRSLCTAHCQRTCGLLFTRWGRALYVLCLPLQSTETVRAFAQKLSSQAFDASEAFTFCFDATSKPQWTVVCLQVQTPLRGVTDMLHTCTVTRHTLAPCYCTPTTCCCKQCMPCVCRCPVLCRVYAIQDLAICKRIHLRHHPG